LARKLSALWKKYLQNKFGVETLISKYMFLSRFEPRNVGKVVVISAAVLVVAFVLIMLTFHVRPVNKKVNEFDDFQLAVIAKAKQIFAEKKAAGIDMSAGPCLSNELDINWVLDVAHNPRDSIDDLPENQCSAFREGRAKHFVELDLTGGLIRLK